MTPRQRELVQMSFEQIKPIAPTAAALFHGRLFSLDPHLQRLFKGDVDEQDLKLMHMIGLAVKGLNRLGELKTLLRDLGARHAGYGVSERDYETFASALIWTLEQGLGKAFTIELRDAWLAVYKMFSQTMRAGARKRLAVADTGTQTVDSSTGHALSQRKYLSSVNSRKDDSEDETYERLTGRFATTIATLICALFLSVAAAHAATSSPRSNIGNGSRSSFRLTV